MYVLNHLTCSRSWWLKREKQKPNKKPNGWSLILFYNNRKKFDLILIWEMQSLCYFKKVVCFGIERGLIEQICLCFRMSYFWHKWMKTVQLYHLVKSGHWNQSAFVGGVYLYIASTLISFQPVNYTVMNSKYLLTIYGRYHIYILFIYKIMFMYIVFIISYNQFLYKH